jgi:hypothetical protein
MFGNDTKDMMAALATMERLSRERTNFNQLAAKEKLKEFLQSDRRFDQFDKDALVSRVMHCRSNGACLDLDDPRLKGGEARPLERNYWR